MAFFDIGINVNVNLGQSVSSVNTFISSMQRLGQVGTQPTQQVAQGLQRIQAAAASTQTSLVQLTAGVSPLTNSFTQLETRMRAAETEAARFANVLRTNTLAPIHTLTAGMNQLGITATDAFGRIGNSLQRVTQSGNALTFLNNQLGQMSTQFIATERSGNRFAELFRGNRGLVFGLSVLSGPLLV